MPDRAPPLGHLAAKIADLVDVDTNGPALTAIADQLRAIRRHHPNNVVVPWLLMLTTLYAERDRDDWVIDFALRNLGRAIKIEWPDAPE